MIPASERSGWTVWLLTTLIVGGALYLFGPLEPDSVLPKMDDGLQIEAETAQLSGAMAVGEDETASHGKYIYLNGSAGDDFTNQAVFCFTVPQSGLYAMAARVRSVAENSTLLIRIDYFDPWLWEPPRSGFTWEEVTAEDGQEAEFRLESGSHVVSIAPQAEEIWLDAIKITATGGALPAAPCPDQARENVSGSEESLSSESGPETTTTSSDSASRLVPESKDPLTPEDDSGTDPTTPPTTLPADSSASSTSAPNPTAPPNTIPGGVLITPGQSIQAAVDAHPEGTTFVIGAGVHSGQSVKPKSFDVFIGQKGAILAGAGVQYAFVGGAKNVEIKDLSITGYKPPLQKCALQNSGGGHNWLVEGNEFYENTCAIYASTGWRVVGNNIHHQRQIGMKGSGNNVLVERNTIAFNNYLNEYDSGWEAGGTKFAGGQGLVVRGNTVHHNEGPGLWTDGDNIHVLYEGNNVYENSGPGIFHEIGYDAIIRNNTIDRNGFGRSGWLDGAGILVNTSSNVEVYGNTVRDNNDGIGGLAAPRGSGGYGPRVLKNLYVHDNFIRLVAGQNGISKTKEVGEEIFTSFGNRFVNNNYKSYSTSVFRWLGGDNYSWTEWQGFGQDLGGTFE